MTGQIAVTVQQQQQSGGLVFPPPQENRQELRDRYESLKTEISPLAKEETQAALRQLADSKEFSAQGLIDTLKQMPVFDFLLSQDARIIEGYTLEEHTSTVIMQLDKYLSDPKIALPLTHAELRIAALFHDIGKALPDVKAEQHLATLSVMNDFRDAIPLSDRAFEIVTGLIGHDPIGKLVIAGVDKFATREDRLAIQRVAEARNLTRDEILEFKALVEVGQVTAERQQKADAVVQSFQERSAALGLSTEELYNLHLLFYQADTSAYTYGAGSADGRMALPGLDFIYQTASEEHIASGYWLGRNPQNGLIQFSEGVQRIIDAITVK